MNRSTFVMNRLSAAAGLALAVGCGQAATPSPSQPQQQAAHDHAHPTEGPHQGPLIELGNDEFHAELIHEDAAKTITIYLLDATATIAASSEAPHVTINLSHNGRAEQFRLAASPLKGDPHGSTSRYASSDAELVAELDHAHGGAQLVANINGKQYRGDILHTHGTRQ